MNYSGLLILVNGEITQYFDTPIYLYVDFSFSRKYSNLITRTINKFSGLKVVFQNCIDEQTNLILSDIYFENYADIQQVIWGTSPHVNDWQLLAIELEKVRKTRYK